MPLVPLTSIGFSNIPAYLNSLFDPDVRAATGLIQRVAQTDLDREAVVEWVGQEAEVNKVISAWYDGWMNPDADGMCPKSDRTFLSFLAKYIKKNHLEMWVPQLSGDGAFAHKAGKSPFMKTTYQVPRYRIDDWRRHYLHTNKKHWYHDNVRLFLQLFAAGAHFVVIHSKSDGVNIQDFYKEFEQTPHIPQRDKTTATGHSHYVAVTSLGTAYAYPNVSTERAPMNAPFICSLIIDTTDAKDYSTRTEIEFKNGRPVKDTETRMPTGDYNTFFQLEGWPGTMTLTGRGGTAGRHGADFDTHQATLWNISTFGLCPYSEKRGTPIFLTPHDYKFSKGPMGMPSYQGARNTASWFKKESQST